MSTSAAEKHLLPLHRISSSPSLADIIQYLRRRWAFCALWAVTTVVVLITLLTPVRDQISEPLAKVGISFTSNSQREFAWDGWENLDKIFAFGDSYSSINFDVEGKQPSRDNPFGNPEAVGFEGTGRPMIGASGPLWVHFATLQYNESVVTTYDFARGGSTIDRDIIGPVWPTASTFKDEVDHQFLPNYGSKFGTLDWDASNTLFAIWFGINDILISYHDLERTPVGRLIEEYAAGLLSLYHNGARNFLVFNVPPFDRTLPAGKPGLLELAADISTFNKRLSAMRTTLLAKYPDMNIFYFDIHALFHSAIADPQQYEQTSQLKETRGPCEAYDLGIGYEGTPDFSRFDSRCSYQADQYFWGDEVHPTYAIHNATAALIVEDCMGHRRQRFCS